MNECHKRMKTIDQHLYDKSNQTKVEFEQLGLCLDHVNLSIKSSSIEYTKYSNQLSYIIEG